MATAMACGNGGNSLGPGSGEEQVVDRAFAGKGVVSLALVSGDCILEEGAADSIRLHLVYAYRPAGVFQPEFEEEGEALVLKETFDGSPSSGRSTWTLTVPPGTELLFTSGSGDLEAESGGEVAVVGVPTDTP